MNLRGHHVVNESVHTAINVLAGPTGSALEGGRFRPLNARSGLKSVQTQEGKFTGDPRDHPLRRQRESRYAHLLKEDPTFRAWYQNVVRGSLNTGKSYLLRT